MAKEVECWAVLVVNCQGEWAIVGSSDNDTPNNVLDRWGVENAIGLNYRRDEYLVKVSVEIPDHPRQLAEDAVWEATGSIGSYDIVKETVQDLSSEDYEALRRAIMEVGAEKEGG